MPKKIDLGYKEVDWEKLPQPIAVTSSSEDSEKPMRTVYPTTYVHEAPSDMSDIPMEGYALVKYKVVERTVTDRKSKKSARMEIELHTFEVQKNTGKAEKPANAMDEVSADDAFEREFAEAASE